MTLRLTLLDSVASDGESATSGARAELSAISGDRLTLLATASAPPGAPVHLATALSVFEGRVRSCQRAADARYVLELRLVNLSKRAREELDALMVRSRPPG
jgi:hypothetical protein